MTSIGTREAKTQLSALLGRVEKGERFTITRYGRPVAELLPVRPRDPARIADTIRRIEGLTRNWTLGGGARDVIDSGRNRGQRQDASHAGSVVPGPSPRPSPPNGGRRGSR